MSAIIVLNVTSRRVSRILLRGALLKIFSRVAKKSISISLTYSCGQVYVHMLLAYSHEHIGMQCTSRICRKNITTQKNGKFELWQSRDVLFFFLVYVVIKPQYFFQRNWPLESRMRHCCMILHQAKWECFNIKMFCPVK